MSEPKPRQRKAKEQKRPSPDVGQTSAIHDLKNKDEIAVLRQEIARLRNENRALQEQIATLSRNAALPRQSSEDALRDQRHNFFKYRNAGRY
jgi:hypothetical protein